MNPAAILLIIQGVQAALAAAPQAIAVAEKAKELIDALFGAKLITAEQQQATKSHIDSIVAMAQAGIIPSHWLVRPDPA